MINMKDLIKKQGDMIRRESGMKLVTEKKELDFNTKAKLKYMTQRNNHTEARMLLSKSMGAKKFVKFYKAMSELNDVFGGYGPELSKLNQKMEKELYKEIKKSFLNSAEVIGLL